MYKVVYLDKVEDDLKNLPAALKRKIIDRIERYLAQNPRILGKPLIGSFKGFWSYRYSDFRVIYRISDEEILIVVARIGHRKEIYRLK